LIKVTIWHLCIEEEIDEMEEEEKKYHSSE
jgi:hypothetical protein